MLDLEVTYLPCPGARAGFAAELGDLGGKMQVPCMVDPNGDGAAMYESDDIIDYLFDRYGPGKDAVPWLLKGPFALWTCAFASFARGLAGNRLAPNARPDNTRMQPLKLWGDEGCYLYRGDGVRGRQAGKTSVGWFSAVSTPCMNSRFFQETLRLNCKN